MADKVENEGAEKAPSTKKVKVKALIHLSGSFGLAWSAGQEFEIESKQAKELEEVQAVKIIK